MKIRTLIAELEKFAPKELAEEYDRIGLMAGDADADCTCVVAALDLTEEVVDEAIREGAQLVVTHHPFIWEPLRSIDLSTAVGRKIAKLLKAGVAVYSAHTNLDKADGGLNFTLAKRLGGKNAKREGIGVTFDADSTLGELAKKVACTLGDESVKVVGDPSRQVRTAYLVTGSGGSDYERAKEVADALITGELKHHQYIDALEEGFGLVEFSHYHSEIIAQDVIAEALKGCGVKIIKAGSACPFRRIAEL